MGCGHNVVRSGFHRMRVSFTLYGENIGVVLVSTVSAVFE